MTKLTKKCFDLVHSKMLASADYKDGYSYGCRRRSEFVTYSLNRLRYLRTTNLSTHSQFAAGMAYALLELIYERASQAGEAA